MIIIMILMIIVPLTLIAASSPFTALYVFPIALRCLRNVNGNTIPLILTGITIFIGLLVLHIFSLVTLLEYGNEVLSSNYVYLPIAHAILSILAVIIGFSLLVIFLYIKVLKRR